MDQDWRYLPEVGIPTRKALRSPAGMWIGCGLISPATKETDCLGAAD